MGFQKTAWYEGARAYGAARGERYGRIAMIGYLLAWIAGVALVLGLIYLVQQGPQEGPRARPEPTVTVSNPLR